jgi:hypothetical protein
MAETDPLAAESSDEEKAAHAMEARKFSTLGKSRQAAKANEHRAVTVSWHVTYNYKVDEAGNPIQLEDGAKDEVFRVGLVTLLDHVEKKVKVHYCSGGYLAGNKAPYKTKWSVWKGRGQKFFWVHKHNVYDVFQLNSNNTIPKAHVDFTLTQIKPGEIDTPAEQDGEDEEEGGQLLAAVDMEEEEVENALNELQNSELAAKVADARQRKQVERKQRQEDESGRRRKKARTGRRGRRGRGARRG